MHCFFLKTFCNTQFTNSSFCPICAFVVCGAKMFKTINLLTKHPTDKWIYCMKNVLKICVVDESPTESIFQ